MKEQTIWWFSKDDLRFFPKLCAVLLFRSSSPDENQVHLRRLLEGTLDEKTRVDSPEYGGRTERTKITLSPQNWYFADAEYFRPYLR